MTNYRCIRFYFSGNSKSESTVDGYDLDSLTNDIAELINDLKCGPCHYVDFSRGGMVALRMVIKYLVLIKSLILIDTSSEPEPRSEMLRNKAMLFVSKYLALKPLAGQVMNLFFGTENLKDHERKSLRTILENHFIANDRVGIVKAVKGMLFRESSTDKINRINHPVTIMVGVNDQLTDISKAEILCLNIENSLLEVVPRAGHISPVEEPDNVNTIIEDHLIHVVS